VNQIRLLGRFLSIASLVAGLAASQVGEHSPQLLLTPKLLRRLQRDRERQTVRWMNFEKRVQTVPDSSERGFELALYYAVVHNPERGKQAIAWVLAHKCQRRQAALVLDWVADLLSAVDRKAITGADCDAAGDVSLLRVTRDRAFMMLANDETVRPLVSESWPIFRKNLRDPALLQPDALYALCEFLQVTRAATHNDLRNEEPEFFSRLPKEYLLSLRPKQIEQPEWIAHIAALAMVALDPNLENSQFLQGWAMEDQQMVREGPGVGYEFLLADPYLPGIAYQNTDPWVYDPAGLLIARTNWDLNACWLSIRRGKTVQENCGADPPRQAMRFGTLQLLPMTPPCEDVPFLKNSETAILGKLLPDAPLVYEHDKRRMLTKADAAGLWRAPNEGSGRLCISPPNKR
jgi:hypothetical protein